MKDDTSLLRTTPLFRGVEEREFSGLLSCLGARPRRFSRGELIFRAGEAASAVGIVLEGAVQIIKEDYVGNRSILGKAEVGEMFGEAFACAQVKSLPVSAEAATDCRILFLDYQRVVTVCPHSCIFHHRLVENMLGIVARKNIALSRKIEHMSKRTTRGKLLSYLLAQAQEAGSSAFMIPFNRQEMADYLCVERSAMSAELGRLRDEGVLRFQKNRFELLELSEEEY